MAYFTSRAEVDEYETNFCSWCSHSKSIRVASGEWECPVMYLSFSWQLGDEHTKGVMLDTLIPRRDGTNCECNMFNMDVPQE